MIMLWWPRSIFARSTCAPSANSPAFMRRRRSRFSSTLRSRNGPGEPAEVTIEARPGRTWAGTIRLVDKLAKPRLASSPVQYFAVVIDLAETDRAVMKPGQRVQSTLTLADEDALVVPRAAVSWQDAKARVARPGGGFTDVTLSACLALECVVESGLGKGDRVALR